MFSLLTHRRELRFNGSFLPSPPSSSEVYPLTSSHTIIHIIATILLFSMWLRYLRFHRGKYLIIYLPVSYLILAV